jgi:hypothetical protein
VPASLGELFAFLALLILAYEGRRAARTIIGWSRRGWRRDSLISTLRIQPEAPKPYVGQPGTLERADVNQALRRSLELPTAQLPPRPALTARRQRSHTRLGWTFLILGAALLLVGLGYTTRCQRNSPACMNRLPGLLGHTPDDGGDSTSTAATVAGAFAQSGSCRRGRVCGGLTIVNLPVCGPERPQKD